MQIAPFGSRSEMSAGNDESAKCLLAKDGTRDWGVEYVIIAVLPSISYEVIDE